jgi:hypothetical protein
MQRFLTLARGTGTSVGPRGPYRNLPSLAFTITARKNG